MALIRDLRAVEPTAVIIAVSGFDRSEQALAAGATGFLNYDRWLMIGSVVENALLAQGTLNERQSANPPLTNVRPG